MTVQKMINKRKIFLKDSNKSDIYKENSNLN